MFVSPNWEVVGVPESYAIQWVLETEGSRGEVAEVAGCLVHSLWDTFFKTYKNVQHRSNTNWDLTPFVYSLARSCQTGYFRSYHSQIETFSCNFHTSFLRLSNWSMLKQITSSSMFHFYHPSLWFFWALCANTISRAQRTAQKVVVCLAREQHHGPSDNRVEICLGIRDLVHVHLVVFFPAAFISPDF